MKTKAFIELPLVAFRSLFPEQAEPIPKFLDRDPMYIVRYDYVSGMLEIGYSDDKWLIE